jgi:two-component system chemotaxis response regulator CheY
MREGQFDLVISDWFMEPVSGLQLLKFIRAEPSFAEVRFLLRVPESDTAAEIASQQAGADGLLVTPYSVEALADTIRYALPE